MPAHVLMQRISGDLLHAVDDDAIEFVRKLKFAEPVKVWVQRIRNYEFHKKYFALVDMAYEWWEPAPLETGKKWMEKVTPQKNKDQFRKDLTILAGYYNAYHRINGEVRVEAKSISFGSMTQDEFEKLYSATIDVILQHICTRYSEEQLRELVDQTMAFA